MEVLIYLVLGLVMLLGAASYVKAKLPKTKTPKLPAWAKPNWKQSWAIPFFDRNPWIKRILIGLFQALIWLLLYLRLALLILLNLSWQFAKKATLPK